MVKLVVFISIITLLSGIISGVYAASEGNLSSELSPAIPLTFIPNEGQVHNSAQYLVKGVGNSIYFFNDSIQITSPGINNSIFTITQTFVGSNKSTAIFGLDPFPGKANFFYGNNASGWKENISTYHSIRYQEIYPGIDLICKENKGKLKREFLIKPYADPSQIKIQFDGQESLTKGTDGELIVKTKNGSLFESPFVCTQNVNGTTVSVQAEYHITGSNVTIDLGKYDLSLPLVIDPDLTYSTYLGGSDNETTGADIVSDSSGNIYVMGTTFSSDLLSGSMNGYQNASGGESDIFVVKLNPATNMVAYATYVGGSKEERHGGITVDSHGNAYITGTTDGDYPETNTLCNISGLNSNVFITKLNPTGSSLEFSCLYGGSNWESGKNIALNKDGDLYVSGDTNSLDLPNTTYAVQSTYNGEIDGFVVGINANGTAILNATYIGGSKQDSMTGICIDQNDSVYVSGETQSSDYNVTPGAFQTTMPSPNAGFITKLDRALSHYHYSSYLGGSGGCAVLKIQSDREGNIYAVGMAGSDFPTTAGAIQRDFKGGFFDAFVTKINKNGSNILYSTYLGGKAADGTSDLALDSHNAIYVTGMTSSPDFPTTDDTYQSESNGGYEGFITKINPSGSSLLASTYYGGSKDDYLTSICLDSSENMVVAGYSSSSDLVTSADAVQKTYGGGKWDSIFARFNMSAHWTGVAPKLFNVTPQISLNTHSASGINLSGSHFMPGAMVSLRNKGNLISANHVSFLSSKNITCTFPTAGTKTGSYDVVITNPDGRSASLSNNFTIIAEMPYAFNGSFGGEGSDNGKFDMPFGITKDLNGTLYVIDSQNTRVQVFDSNGSFLTKWGSSGSNPGQFHLPSEIAIDSSGNVYISDSGNDRIQKFNRTGTFISEWGTAGTGDGQFNGPIGIALDLEDNIYVADAENNRIQKFNETGGFMTSWGAAGTGEGQFKEPFGITINNKGNIFVTELQNNRIQVFNPEGTFIRSWGMEGSEPGNLSSPTGIASDRNGYIYIVDTGNSRVQKFDSEGQLITLWGKMGSNAGAFLNALSICLNEVGEVYIADTLNNRIQIFKSQTENNPGILSISGINPATSPNTGPVSTIITGKNFQSGVTVSLVNSSIKIPGTASVINNTTIISTFQLSGAPTSVFNLVVKNPDEYTTILSKSFTIKNATPTISSLTPSSGFNVVSIPVTITGTGLRNGVTVSLSNGIRSIQGIITNRTTTKILCTFQLNGTDAGIYNLTVVNIDGTRSTKTNGFTVFPADNAPVITNFTPSSGINNSTLPLTIKGTNLRNGIIVTIMNNTTTKSVPATVKNSSMITCSLPLAGLPIGIYNLSVTNTDKTSFFVPDALLVMNPTPKITAISPVLAYNTSTLPITITGGNFALGCTVLMANNSTIIQGVISQFTSAKFTGTFALSGSPAGIYNLTITNPGGPNSTKQFTLRSPASIPAIDTINPATGVNNGSILVLINGSGFGNGARVTITNGSVEKIATSIFRNTNQLKCTLPLTGLPYGMYNLTVTNTDGSSGNKSDALMVTNPFPAITTLSPSSSYVGNQISVTVTGSRFVAGLKVDLVNGSNVIPGTVSGYTSTKFTGTFDLANASNLTYNLKVTNPGGPNCSKPFVVSDPGLIPDIFNYIPLEGVNTGPVPFIINGTNFRTGATVTITNNTTIKTITAKITGNYQISCSLPLTGLNAGPYNLTVRNTDGSNVTRMNGFLIKNPFPIITSISPASGFTNHVVSVSITGSRFVTGLELALVNNNCSIPGSVSGFTTSKFTGTFNLSGAANGTYNLTITNPGGQNATKPFLVNGLGNLPIVDNITPTSGINTAPLPVTITGTNFRTGAMVTITNTTTIRTMPGIVTGNTKISCSLPITGLPYGLYNLTVRNIDGTNYTRHDSFTVTNPTPVITTVGPVSGYTTGPVNITIIGSKFSPGAAISLVKGSIIIAGTVNSLTALKITGTFQLTGSEPGLYNLTVTNPGTIGGTKVKAFTILIPGNNPIISTINPASGFNNANLPVTIIGANFKTPIVYLNQGSLQKQAVPTAGKASTASTLYVTLPLSGVPGGLCNLTIRNSDGVNGTAEEIFYVTDQAWISKPKTVGHQNMIPITGLSKSGGQTRFRGNLGT